MQSKKIIILGAGMIGRAIALDLCRAYKVTSADLNESALKHLKEESGIDTIHADLSDVDGLKKMIEPFDLVVSAVPGFMGFKTLKAIIEAGKDVVDISFFPEDPLDLRKLAEEKAVTAIVDCGVAPGLCNIIAGHHHAVSPLTEYECLVGGLPKKREWPFEYKAPFSPIDVIEEYTRPARMVENGQIVIKEALSDPEPVEFAEIGVLEAFNTDGLRTLLTTFKGVPEMREKTMRYPGHIELMKVLRETGLFSKEELTIKGKQIAPIDLMTNLLFPKWKFNKGEEDITVMRVSVTNAEGKTVYTLIDHPDLEKEVSSMGRTTAYTCTAAVNLLMNGLFTKKGVFPPELLGSEKGAFQYLLNYLKDRNIELKKEIIN